MPFIDIDRLDPQAPREGWTGRFASHSVKALTTARAIVVDHPRRHSIGGVEL